MFSIILSTRNKIAMAGLLAVIGLSVAWGLQPDLEGAIEVPGEWLTYTDDTYGFSINYPDTLVVLPEPNALPKSRPIKAHRVRFQDRQKAEGQFADKEPAHFSVEVFELDEPVALQDWLEDNGLLPKFGGPATGPASLVEPVELENTRKGLHIRLPILLAPNEYYYFATDVHVYRLIPLGVHSEDMLDSFTLP